MHFFETALIDDESLWAALSMRRAELDAQNVFCLFRREGIEPILIKGLAAAATYPEGKYRPSSDIDIAVSKMDHPKAASLLSAAKQDLKVEIDLHCELRKIDTVPWDRLFDRSRYLNPESQIRVLSHEDHLRVLSTHWLNDGGMNKERLWDIYYVIDCSRGEFDWDFCLNEVSPNRRGWIAVTVGLTHKYFGLDIKGLPVEAEAARIPDWIVKTVEKEWKFNIPLLPLHSCIGDLALFRQQLRKRIPPNPIQATIEMEGDLLYGNRYAYQFGNFFRRIPPAARRIANVIAKR